MNRDIINRFCQGDFTGFISDNSQTPACILSIDNKKIKCPPGFRWDKLCYQVYNDQVIISNSNDGVHGTSPLGDFVLQFIKCECGRDIIDNGKCDVCLKMSFFADLQARTLSDFQ